jgi:hypothetical protein
MSEHRQHDASSDSAELLEARSTYVAKVRDRCRRSVIKWRRLPLLALQAIANPHESDGKLPTAFYDRLWTVVDTAASHMKIVVDCETGEILEVGQTTRRLARDHIITSLDPDALDPDLIAMRLARDAAAHLEGCDQEWRAKRRDTRAQMAVDLELVYEPQPDIAAGAEPPPDAPRFGTQKGHLRAVL